MERDVLWLGVDKIGGAHATNVDRKLNSGDQRYAGRSRASTKDDKVSLLRVPPFCS